MKLSCKVIRDLLPLYAENLTSEESSALVDEHLCGCDECAKQLGILKKAQAIPVETDAPGLKKIRKAIVRRRVLAVTMAVMLVITLVLGAALFFCGPAFLALFTTESAVIVTNADDLPKLHIIAGGIVSTGTPLFKFE